MLGRKHHWAAFGSSKTRKDLSLSTLRWSVPSSRNVLTFELRFSIAGAVSNLLIAMIKRPETAIFVDFRDHDLFGTMLQTVTHVGIPPRCTAISASIYLVSNGILVRLKPFKQDNVTLWSGSPYALIENCSTLSPISSIYALSSPQNVCYLKFTTGTPISTYNRPARTR